MVTGHLPFEAPTPYALMHKHLTEQPPPPQTWRADLPDSIKKVLEQAMAKKPNNRFPSAKGFADAFEEALEKSGVENKSTAFFTAPLPNRPKPVESPLVDGTPFPSTPYSRPPTPAPILEQVSAVPLQSRTPYGNGTPSANQMPG
jgi:serine/threonine-protein kinase